MTSSTRSATSAAPTANIVVRITASPDSGRSTAVGGDGNERDTEDAVDRVDAVTILVEVGSGFGQRPLGPGSAPTR